MKHEFTFKPIGNFSASEVAEIYAQFSSEDNILTHEEILEKTMQIVNNPSLINKALNFGDAIFEWAGSGFKTVSDEKINDRFSICRTCEFWDEKGFLNTGKCKKCGCSTELKLKLSTSTCPIGKW